MNTNEPKPTIKTVKQLENSNLVVDPTIKPIKAQAVHELIKKRKQQSQS